MYSSNLRISFHLLTGFALDPTVARNTGHALLGMLDSINVGRRTADHVLPSTIFEHHTTDYCLGKSHEEYCQALVDLQLCRIPESVCSDRNMAQGSIEDHIRLAEITEEVLRSLIHSSQLSDISEPVLLHADLHKRNIFVSDDDPGTITCLIDWQATSIEPSYIYANEKPDLCTLDKRWRVIGDSDDDDNDKINDNNTQNK